MFGRIKSAKPAAAVSIGVVALLVIGGGSAAAKALITGSDIKNGTVTGADVKNHSLHIRDLGRGTVAKLHGADGKDGNDGIQVVTAAGGKFSTSNSTVKFTQHGVTYGPYTDSGNEGGTLIDTTLAGKHLRDIAELAYTAKYVGDNNGAAPYLRIFIDDPATPDPIDHDVIFSASTQPEACAGPGGGGSAEQCDTSGRMIKYIVNEGTVRYDDDGGNAQDVSWDSIINAHGSDVIGSIRISNGFALGGMTSSAVNSLIYELAGKAPHTVSFSN
jgi:hypothetical protein